MKKKTGYLLLIVLLVTIVSTVRIKMINAKDAGVIQEEYSMGESVDIGENIFWDAMENASGYSVEVKSAELLSYEEYLEKHGIQKEMANEIFESWGNKVPKMIVDVDINVKNNNTTDSAEKGIQTAGFQLVDRDCRLQLSSDLFVLANPSVSGNSFALRSGTEMNFSFPFAFDPSDIAYPIPEKRVRNGKFSLAVSLYPVQKNIRIELQE